MAKKKQHASDQLPTIPVVIVQTSELGLFACEDGLPKAGFREGREYILNDEADGITEHDIMPGERQLLVIGTIHGNKGAADEFVRKMKVKNPKLEAAFFSIFSSGLGPNIQPYDTIIAKSFGSDPIFNLTKKMREFLKK